MQNSNSKYGANDHNGVNVGVSSSSQIIAKPLVSRRFWYLKEIHICVFCGREKIYKERVYNENEKGVKCVDYACSEHFM